MFEKKECCICKSEFVAKRKKSITCSKKCYKKLSYKKETAFVKNCDHCGSEFKTKKENTKYCSISCSNAAQANCDLKIDCKFCGNQFTVPFIKRNRQFCSKSCSTSYSNDNRTSESFKRAGETLKQKYKSGETKHPFLGTSHSDETKQKISKIRKEKGLARGKNNPMFGKTHTKESREKMSDTRTEKILNGEYNGWFKKGKHYSPKLLREVIYRSSWEEKAYQILDNDEKVISYQEEPCRISYYYETYKRYYIPDILITYNDGTQKLIEIKPSYFLEAKVNKAKFTAAKEYCEKRNWIFEVWTESSL